MRRYISKSITFKTLLVLLFVISFSGVSTAAKLTLEDSIGLAIRNNKAVIASQKKSDAASARVGQAFSGYLPKISLSSNYTRNFSSPFDTVINGIPVRFGFNEPADIKGWQANFNQNIFTFGKLENSVRLAMDAAASAREELRKTEQDTIFQVSSAYFNVIKSQKMVDVTQQSLDMTNSHLDQVKAMFRVGMSTKADVLRSQVSVSSAQNGLIKARNGFEIAKAAFNNAIDADLEKAVDLSESGINYFEVDAPDYASLLKVAMKNRPDIKISDYSSSIASSSAGLAKAQWLPSVSAQGNYGWSNTVYNTNAINYDQTNWTVAAAASWDIFNGFDTQAKIKEASANLDAAKASKELVIKIAELDVKQAFLNLSAARDIISSSKDEAASAQENFDIATIRFKNGLGTNIEMLDAQSALTKARFDLLSAQFDLELAKAQIERSAGISDLPRTAKITVRSAIEGTVQYIDLEGGFYGFTDANGNKYVITGKKKDEIAKYVGKSTDAKNIKIKGYSQKGKVTFSMWGTPFDTEDYEF